MSQEANKRSDENEKKTFADLLTLFIVKFRFVLLGILVAGILAIVAVGVVSSMNEKAVKAGLTEIDKITDEYATLKFSETTDTAKEDELIAKAQAVADKNGPVVVKVRANILVAEIQYGRKNYEAARAAWLAAAEADKKSYTFGLCNYQCGICSDELGDYDSAVAYLNAAAESEDFADVPRALFNIGRIEESRGNYEKAAETYKKLFADYPSDQWATLAKSRLISLSVDGKAN
ncbi:MAG: tetratricopeptide repeat protein [Spirochaetaceae bacterium]|nr:tetratricopeptide repeat protein [Spirochaetaceae bacterium]MBR3814142.1 tetratricopeptide repeat protein [Spirochaetaceae bacterium]